MTTNTENAKVFKGIIFPIMVNMMHLQFLFFLTAKITFLRKFTECYLAVFVFMRITSCLTAIAAIKRAVFFFEIFSSRFRKSELFSANLAFPRHGKQFANSFSRAVNRTASGLSFFKLFWSYKKIFTAYRADFFDRFSLEIVMAKSRAKRILVSVGFVGAYIKRRFTEIAKDFHIQHNRTQAPLNSTYLVAV